MPNDVLTRHGVQDRPNRFDLPPKPPAEGTGSVYDLRPYRPMWQLVVRGALWTALGIGCIGGIVALLGIGQKPTEEVIVDDGGADQSLDVPAPVAGTAERAVRRWLTATEDDQKELDELFVEPATLVQPTDGDGLTVTDLTTLTGHQVQPGYWVVSIQADVIETFDNEQQPPATWYLELGVVGDVTSGLSALSTPAILPAPGGDFTNWASSRPPMRQPETGDTIASTVEGFLGALLADKGDPSRYLADGVVMTSAQPVPFSQVTVSTIAAEDEEDGSTHVWVDVLATTTAGRVQPVSYELIVIPRDDDRWEIKTLWGAPSLGEAPAADAPAEGE